MKGTALAECDPTIEAMATPRMAQTAESLAACALDQQINRLHAFCSWLRYFHLIHQIGRLPRKYILRAQGPNHRLEEAETVLCWIKVFATTPGFMRCPLDEFRIAWLLFYRHCALATAYQTGLCVKDSLPIERTGRTDHREASLPSPTHGLAKPYTYPHALVCTTLKLLPKLGHNPILLRQAKRTFAAREPILHSLV